MLTAVAVNNQRGLMDFGKEILASLELFSFQFEHALPPQRYFCSCAKLESLICDNERLRQEFAEAVGAAFVDSPIEARTLCIVTPAPR